MAKTARGRRTVLAILWGLACVASVLGQPQSLSDKWLKAVVPLSVARCSSAGGTETTFYVPIGSAILVSDGGKLLTVTARHVVRGLDGVYLTLRLVGGRLVRIKLGKGSMDFVFPADTALDLAVAGVPAVAESLDIWVFRKQDVLPSDSLRPGEPVYVVGFPLGITAWANTPMVKGGVVALVPRGGDEFCIDSNLFPGNSGGPVLTQPSAVDLRTGLIELGAPRSPRLLGIALRTFTWCEEAASRTTGRTRAIFEENSGLYATS